MKRLIVGLIALVIAAGSTSARAGMIIDDAVFAHDFEQISGSTATALVGPNATITSTSAIVPSTTDPKGGSTQHITPISSGNLGKYVNTNAYLAGSTSELSFTIFYNDRGDNGGDWVNSIDRAILLAAIKSYDLFDDLRFNTESLDGDRILRFEYRPESSAWGPVADSTVTLPDADNTWHQAGFVYEGEATDGMITFYFDGEVLGSTVSLPGLSEIGPLDAPWTFIEDYYHGNSASRDEYYDNGFYDDAALWTRALGADEMKALYQDGITAIPEPSTFILLTMGAVGLLLYGWRRRVS